MTNIEILPKLGGSLKLFCSELVQTELESDVCGFTLKVYSHSE